MAGVAVAGVAVAGVAVAGVAVAGVAVAGVAAAAVGATPSVVRIECQDALSESDGTHSWESLICAGSGPLEGRVD